MSCLGSTFVVLYFMVLQYLHLYSKEFQLLRCVLAVILRIFVNF